MREDTLHSKHSTQGKGWIIFLIVLAVIILLAVSMIPGINRIPTLDEEVTAAWSQVTNQYKRRADLIPNLVNTVKGYAEHEKQVLTAVTEARAKVSQTVLPKDVLTNSEAFRQYQANQDRLSSALSRLLVVIERYPDLKANQNFLSLQAQLEGTENRIAVARRDYIESVKRFNTEIRTIPGRWLQGMFFPELNVKENFTAPETVTEPPQVNFN